MSYRFILEPYEGMSNRFMCPNCRNRKNTFTRYIDTETQCYLADHVGMCARKDKCGYHFSPHEFFETNPDKRPGYNHHPFNRSKPEPVTDYRYLPWPMVSNTMRKYGQNNFVAFLTKLFGPEQALFLAFKYKIGTSKYWRGATIFWQVDMDERVRTGKVMLYDANTCRRVKEPVNHITWVHTLLTPKPQVESHKSDSTRDLRLKTQDLQIKQCFFGEHLLSAEPQKIVAIAESEKTAIIASVYLSDYLWLAAGSADGLSLEKCKVLEGREVILFPDVNSYAKWHDKARFLSNHLFTTKFRINGKLERNATPEERERGIDLADRWIDEALLEWEVERS